MKYHVLAAVAAFGLLSATNVASAAGVKESILAAINVADVRNEGRIEVGRVTGDGASVSISATGAVAQISISSVNAGKDGSCVCKSTVHETALIAFNSGDVHNEGSIETRNVSGAGANVSISAMGAGAIISISDVNGAHSH